MTKLFGKSSTFRPPRARTKTHLQVEQLDERVLLSTGATYVNPGAPIIPNVQIETVFYGADWSGQAADAAVSAQLAAEAQDLNQFFAQITNSSYMDGLSQYAGSNGAPGRGTFARTDFVAASPYGTVSETAVQTMLANEITKGKLDAPNGNTLYVVFMPPGATEAGDVGSGGGHHSSFATPLGSGTAYYATIENPLTFGARPRGYQGSETNLQLMTETASHEMVEAITDPVVNVAGRQAWYDTTTGDEIGDLTNNNPPPGGVMGLLTGNSYSYVVQRYWNNNDPNGASETPGVSDFQNIQSLSPFANMSFTVVTQDGRSFSVGWSDGSGWFDGKSVNVSLSGAGQKVDVQLYDAQTGALLFSGSFSAPSGNWAYETGGGEWVASDDMELSGTTYENGQALATFGTGGGFTQQYTGAQYGSSYTTSDNPNTSYQSHRKPVQQ
jgi:hypothetical protein